MAKGIFYDGSTPRGLHLRAVVTQTGDVVAKNYDSRKLIDDAKEVEPGDVGVTVRLDGRTDTLTSAQQASLQHVAREMSGKLLERSGVESDFGFKPGTVVEAHRDRGSDAFVGYVEKQADGGLYLRCFDQDMRLKRVFVPMSVYQVEEVPDRCGLDGLFVHQARKGNCYVSVALSKHPLSADACREVWAWMRTAKVDQCDEGDAERLLRRINDQELIRKEASDAKSRFRFVAAELVEDQELLVSFLRFEWWQGREISPIIEKIQDEASIQKAILCWLDNRVSVPEAAWKRIICQDLAVELFQHPNFPSVRESMLDLVRDTEVLKTLVLTSRSLAFAAIRRLGETDRIQLFEDIKGKCRTDWQVEVCVALVRAIEDQAWLEKLGLEDNSGLFNTVVPRLTDLEAALRVMLAHHSYYAYLSREKLLKRLYDRVESTDVALNIIRISTDRAWLAGRATHGAHTKSAQDRLDELGPEAAPEPVKPAKRARKSGPKK